MQFRTAIALVVCCVALVAGVALANQPGRAQGHPGVHSSHHTGRMGGHKSSHIGQEVKTAVNEVRDKILAAVRDSAEIAVDGIKILSYQTSIEAGVQYVDPLAVPALW